MSKTNLDTVKKLIDELMLSVEEKIEDSGEVKLEITYPTLEVGAEVMEGDVVAPDGEYEVEDDVKIIVKDGKISEIIKPESTESEAVEVVAVEDPQEAVVENPEAVIPDSESTEADTPKVVDVLNIDQLEQLIDISKLENAYCTISFSVYDGKILWGEVYTSDYKQLMSKQEKELNELREKIKTKDSLILELGKEVEKKPLIQAPVGDSQDIKLSRIEIIKQSIQNNKNK